MEMEILRQNSQAIHTEIFFLKVKNSLLELENDFIGLKDEGLKDRELKIRKEIEALFFKPIILSIDDTDRSEQKETKKK